MPFLRRSVSIPIGRIRHDGLRPFGIGHPSRALSGWCPVRFQFDGPSAVCVAADVSLLVADTNNHVIRRIHNRMVARTQYIYIYIYVYIYIYIYIYTYTHTHIHIYIYAIKKMIIQTNFFFNFYPRPTVGSRPLSWYKISKKWVLPPPFFSLFHGAPV